MCKLLIRKKKLQVITLGFFIISFYNEIIEFVISSKIFFFFFFSLVPSVYRNYLTYHTKEHGD